MDDPFSKLDKLGDRELLVLILVCQGFSFAQVAKKLTIQPESVRSTMQHVYKKLDLKKLVPEKRVPHIFEEYCPHLVERKPVPPKQPEPPPEPVGDPEIEKMVDQDEMALAVYRGLIPFKEPIKPPGASATQEGMVVQGSGETVFVPQKRQEWRPGLWFPWWLVLILLALISFLTYRLTPKTGQTILATQLVYVSQTPAPTGTPIVVTRIIQIAPATEGRQVGSGSPSITDTPTVTPTPEQFGNVTFLNKLANGTPYLTDAVVLYPKTIQDVNGVFHGDPGGLISMAVDRITGFAKFFRIPAGPYVICGQNQAVRGGLILGEVTVIAGETITNTLYWHQYDGFTACQLP